MDMVPLREYLDQRFEDHQRHVDQRFDELKTEVRGLRVHDHGGYVTWTVFVAALVSVIGWILVFV